MTMASSGPPPTVPAMVPSGATIISAPASRGADRAVDVTVQKTKGSRALLLRAASANNSASVRFIARLPSLAQRHSRSAAPASPRLPPPRAAAYKARRDRPGGGVRLRRDRDGPRRGRRDQQALLRSRLPGRAEAAVPRGRAGYALDHPEHLHAGGRQRGGGGGVRAPGGEAAARIRRADRRSPREGRTVLPRVRRPAPVHRSGEERCV